MTDKTISTREADLLRKRIAFVVRDGGYRVVCTDSESPDGILPRCTSPAHPEDDRERQWDVLDCCQTEDGYRLIETGHEHIAAVWVDSLYVIPALLDERDALRARVTELEQLTAAQAVERNDDESDLAAQRVRATHDRHAARGSIGGEYLDADVLAVLDNREAWRNLALRRGAALDVRDAKADG